MTYKIFLILSINFSTTIRPTVKQWTCQSINNPSISLDEYSCDKSAISLVSTCRPSICRNLIEPSSTSTIVTLRQHTLSCGMSTASPKQCVQFRRWRPATDGDVRCLMNGPSARRSQTAVNDRVSFEYFLKCERQRATELHASTAMCDTSDCDSCMVCDIAVCRVTSSTPRQQWSVWSVPSGQWSVREPSELMVTGTRTTSVITSPIYSNYIEKNCIQCRLSKVI